MRAIVVVLAAAALGGCYTPLVETTGPLAVTDVAVTAKSTVRSETDIAPKVERRADAVIVSPNAPGQRVTVDVEIGYVGYKNPVQALLVGDSNEIHSHVTVRGEDGAEVGAFDHNVRLDGEFQGVVGLMQGALQKNEQVDDRLAEAYAAYLSHRIYGAQTGPLTATRPPAAASATSPAPAAPAAATPVS